MNGVFELTMRSGAQVLVSLSHNWPFLAVSVVMAACLKLFMNAGTSLGAIAGLLTIARWRVVAVVVGTLWVTAVVFGTAYNVL
jgi:hypothetical protein